MLQKAVMRIFSSYYVVPEFLPLRKNLWIMLIGDTGLVILAHLFAYLIRFDAGITEYMPLIINWLPFLILIKLTIFYYSGLYRGIWKYTSITDIINIFRSVAISSGIVVLLVLYFN